MKKNLFIYLIVIIALISCGHEQPPMQFKWEAATTPFGGMGVCCKVAGNTCQSSGLTYIPPAGFRTYAQTNNIAGYFKNENWQSLFPELVGQTDLINSIKERNPKTLILDEKYIAFLINPDLGPTTDNVYVVLRLASGSGSTSGSPECDQILAPII